MHATCSIILAGEKLELSSHNSKTPLLKQHIKVIILLKRLLVQKRRQTTTKMYWYIAITVCPLEEWENKILTRNQGTSLHMDNIKAESCIQDPASLCFKKCCSACENKFFKKNQNSKLCFYFRTIISNLVQVPFVPQLHPLNHCTRN